MGSEHPNIVPYGSSFACADGLPLTLAVGSDRQFARLCEVLGWAMNPDWATLSGRHQHKEALLGALASAFSQRDCATWLEMLEEAQIPAGAVRGVHEALRTAQAHRLHLHEPVQYDPGLHDSGQHDPGLHGLRTAVFVPGTGIPLGPPPPFDAELTLGIRRNV
ncbi:MAG: CoA transferase, partial [Bacteroidota bacterium]